MRTIILITFILTYWMSLLPVLAASKQDTEVLYHIQHTDTLYKLQKQNEKIQRYHTMIKRMTITICVMTSAFLSTSLLLWIAYRKLRSFRNKKQQTNIRNHNIPAETAIKKPKPPVEIANTDSYHFKRIERIVKEEKLYLNPDLSRQDILDRLSINKNHFSRIMQKHLQMTLPEYLSHLRVQHAIQLMNEKPNFTIQALAEESGFNNLRNFQRIFKSVTGMTFSEYKEFRNGGVKILNFQYFTIYYNGDYTYLSCIFYIE